MNILSFVISLFASIIGAISGIGGGIIIKPFLDATKLFSLGTINFLSGCTVLAMTSMSMLLIKRGTTSVNLNMSTFLGVGAAVGGIAGKELFEVALQSAAKSTTVGIVQSFLLLIITVAVFFFVRFKGNFHSKHIGNLFIVFSIGLGLGTISAFLGIGGGPLNIAMLNYFFSMDGKAAAINSLYIIFISQIFSLVSILVTKSVPSFDTSILIFMVAGGLLGAIIGRSFNKNMNSQRVDAFFCIVLVSIALLNIWNIVRYLV